MGNFDNLKGIDTEHARCVGSQPISSPLREELILLLSDLEIKIGELDFDFRSEIETSLSF